MLHCLVSRAGISYSPFNRRIHLRDIRRSGIQPPLRGLHVRKYRHEWLVQFVSDRGCKFSDGRQPRSLCEFDTRVAKAVFCSFSLIDVNREAIPLNDLTLRITQRFAHHLMPSVLSICTSQAAYCAVRLSSFDCPEECLRSLLQIIGMNESLPPAINGFFEGSPKIFKESLSEMSSSPVGEVDQSIEGIVSMMPRSSCPRI
jgi:hypothetical protein